MYIDKRHTFTPEERLNRIKELLNPAIKLTTERLLRDIEKPISETLPTAYFKDAVIETLDGVGFSLLCILADISTPYEEITYGKFGEPREVSQH